jgi:hypothetical protein
MKKEKKKTISIPVSLLQDWALCLSQGDNSPRREIEKILTDKKYPTRNRY